MKYQLEPYKPGGANRYSCPHCGGRKCFARYIDVETGLPVGDTCGRCNHHSSCGYHLTPRQYFEQHPDERPAFETRTYSPAPPPPPRPLCTLPQELIGQCLSVRSQFCQWLQSVAPSPEAYERVCQLYQLGATRDGGVIYWQQDSLLRLRTGKVMHYGPDGHRMGNPNWVHAMMRRQGQLPEDWVLTQCLFGEHLLSQDHAPGSSDLPIVGLVESEKTAVLMAAFMPEHTWVATGGCDLLSVPKVQVLRGRRVMVYPDSGCLDKWSKVMAQTAGIDYTISADMEAYPPNTDIGDVLLQK